MESYKKDNKDLKEKVNSLQIELTEKEVSEYAWSKEIFLKACVGCVHMAAYCTHGVPLYFSIVPYFLFLSVGLYMTFKLWHYAIVRPLDLNLC